MSLKFPGAWRFRPPVDGRFVNSAVPHAAVEECIGHILRMAAQSHMQQGFGHFKRRFCAASGVSHVWSSSASWAETDLRTFAHEATKNAPLFIEAFYDSCRTLGGEDRDAWALDAEMINEILARHSLGYVVRPPHLEAREEAAAPVPVQPPPPTLAERGATLLQESPNRSEELLAEGRGREAVKESLRLLETVATAFRGTETATGTVEFRYFNQIVRSPR